MKTEFPRARKRFGQHFLEAAWVARLIDKVAPCAGDTFLEIGPGRGALTSALAPRVGRLLAVEIDRTFCRTIRANRPELDLIEDDVSCLTGETLRRRRNFSG